jgi:MFS family permease
MGIVAPLSGTLSDRIGSRPVTVAGLATMTAGYVAAAILFEGATTALAAILVGLIVGFGMGVFQSPNNSAILGSVPPDRLGVTSGMLTINRTTGGLTGIAILGTLWAARTVAYAGGGTAADAPAAAQAAALSDTMAFGAGILGLALVLGLWAWRSGKDVTRAAAPPGR